MPDPRAEQITRIIDAIEGELRRLDLWEQAPPPARALMSEQPFCFDTLTFTQWLQWVFVVRVRLILSENLELPDVSDIHPLAEHAFQPLDYDSGRLLELIRQFDVLINNAG